MTVMSLLNQVRNNEVVLPSIQRDFVWNEERIATLLDSVMRGYPIGIALLWETYEDIQYREFVADYRHGGLHTYKVNSSRGRVKMVLDGQQRLQSLYVALYGTYDGKSLYFDILSGRESADTADDKFGFWFATAAEAKTWNKDTEEEFPAGYYDDEKHVPEYYVRVADVYSMGLKEREQFVKNIGTKIPLRDDDRTRVLSNLGTMVEALSHRESILQVSVIDENLALDSPQRHVDTDVLEIFVRVNTQGTRLNRSDLIFSWLKLNWKEAAQTLPEFINQVNKGHSLMLDTDLVVQCLLAVSNLGTRRDLEVLRRRDNVALLRENFGKCCDAIRAAVDFVVRDCSCQGADLLGGAANLIPFVYYLFHTKRHEMPNSQLEQARKAFYLLALARPFSRYGESRVGAFIRDEMEPRAKKADMLFPFDDLVIWTNYWEDIEAFDERLLQHNVSLTLHLLQGLSGAKVQYSGNSPEVDHIFPRSTLREQDVDEKLINHFANFWILAKGKNRNKSNQHPAKYFKDVSGRVLTQALIGRDMLDYRKFTTFVRQRSMGIVARLKSQLGFKDEDFEWERDEG